jgi:hypothetical protein
VHDRPLWPVGRVYEIDDESPGTCPLRGSISTPFEVQHHCTKKPEMLNTMIRAQGIH